MADTLQDLRRHIDDLIGRLSEEEEHIVDPVDAAPSQAPEGLDTQIETLGHKIEGASDVLAELSDLLESQTERIETIEHQLGEPEDLGSTPAAVQAGRPSESADRALPALEIAMQQGLARVEQRLLAIEARLGSFEAVVAELRGRALQRDREACDLEDRVLALAEAALSGTSEVGAVAQGAAPAPEIVEPASTPVAESAAPPVAATAPLPQPQAQVLPQTAAVESRAEEAPSVEILDSAAAKRLEELVEREVRLQHQFDPGAAVEPQSRRGRPTVMVVDDSADARTVLSIYLSKTGFQVVSASSAEDCLGKLRHHRVDAVVLDASMPGASGAHVCAVLRGDAGDSAQARLPVIVYTGYPDDFTREMAEKWGADEYVVKGGDMLPLMSALIRCTEKQPPQELKQGSSATL